MVEFYLRCSRCSVRLCCRLLRVCCRFGCSLFRRGSSSPNSSVQRNVTEAQSSTVSHVLKRQHRPHPHINTVPSVYRSRQAGKPHRHSPLPPNDIVSCHARGYSIAPGRSKQQPSISSGCQASTTRNKHSSPPSRLRRDSLVLQSEPDSARRKRVNVPELD